MINRKALKKLSKDQLNGQWTVPVLITLFIMVLQIILQSILKIVNFGNVENLGLDILWFVLSTFILLTINVMINSFYLKISKGSKVKFSDLFINTKTWIKGIGIQLLMTLIMLPLIVIYSILLVITMLKYFNYIMMSGFGITAYSPPASFYLIMLLFILIFAIALIILELYLFPALIIICEDNNNGLWKSIKYSFKMMRGNVWGLFVLQLSFIGWALLCILTFGIGFLWLIPYTNTTLFNFYNEIRDKSQTNANYNDITSLT
ncbi:MAG: DUF975 family protein [Clostridium sp.]|uniref:DUF975 family protein n=1 Tax=Clostridium sp. TaxID=1506 RepID=UPI0030237D11